MSAMSVMREHPGGRATQGPGRLRVTVPAPVVRGRLGATRRPPEAAAPTKRPRSRRRLSPPALCVCVCARACACVRACARVCRVGRLGMSPGRGGSRTAEARRRKVSCSPTLRFSQIAFSATPSPRGAGHGPGGPERAWSPRTGGRECYCKFLKSARLYLTIKNLKSTTVRSNETSGRAGGPELASKRRDRNAGAGSIMARTARLGPLTAVTGGRSRGAGFGKVVAEAGIGWANFCVCSAGDDACQEGHS